MGRLAAALWGGSAGAALGFVVALAFGDQLFVWHDNIGPELRVAFIGAAIGMTVGITRSPRREAEDRKEHGE